MDFQELSASAMKDAPPVMPWQAFAEWIHMTEEPQVVRGWLDRGYVPSLRIGKRLMVNIELFRKQLLDRED